MCEMSLKQTIGGDGTENLTLYFDLKVWTEVKVSSN